MSLTEKLIIADGACFEAGAVIMKIREWLDVKRNCSKEIFSYSQKRTFVVKMFSFSRKQHLIADKGGVGQNIQRHRCFAQAGVLQETARESENNKNRRNG